MAVIIATCIVLLRSISFFNIIMHVDTMSSSETPKL